MTTDQPESASPVPASGDRLQRQFVILHHDHPFVHWDFLIEDGDMLAAWRLLEYPECGKCIPAEPLSAHRRHYLTWEGPVGGDRGSVTRVFSGWLVPQMSKPGTADWLDGWCDIIDCELAGRCRLIRDRSLLCWEFC